MSKTEPPSTTGFTNMPLNGLIKVSDTPYIQLTNGVELLAANSLKINLSPRKNVTTAKKSCRSWTKTL